MLLYILTHDVDEQSHIFEKISGIKKIAVWENYPYVPNIGNIIKIEELQKGKNSITWSHYVVDNVVFYDYTVEVFVTKQNKQNEN